jgi:hypothetical protein
MGARRVLSTALTPRTFATRWIRHRSEERSSAFVVRYRNEDGHQRLFSKPRFGDCHEETYHLHRRSRTCLFFCRSSQGMHQGCNRWGRRGFSRRSRQGRRSCWLCDRSPRSQQGGRGKSQSTGSDLALKRRRQNLVVNECRKIDPVELRYFLLRVGQRDSRKVFKTDDCIPARI